MKNTRPLGSDEPTPQEDEFSKDELEAVTAVFRQFETGVREASIDAGDLLSALKCLGLNTMEQEIMDLSNNLSKDGLIFFPDFCSIVLRRYREEDEEEFAKTMFKVFCGTDPLPTEFRAKKYKVYQKYLTKAEFQVIMRSLPVPLEEAVIDEMFQAADDDGDGKIGFEEFRRMINPPPLPKEKKPTKAEIASHFQDCKTKMMREES